MHGRYRVLIVDDNAALRRSLAEQLALGTEFASAHCDSAAAALRLLSRERFDAVLLDGGLPEIAAPEFCRRIRRADPGVAIVVMTAAPAEPTTPAGPHADGDDYIARPFRLEELLSRLRAQRARNGRDGGTGLTIGRYSLDPATRLMIDNSDGRKIRLTDKEAAILAFLHRADGAIDRDTLLEAVWGYNAKVTTHTLETHVYRLRRKIERDPARAEILVTEPGGYRLVA